MKPKPADKDSPQDTSWFAWLAAIFSSDTSSKPADTGGGGEYHDAGSGADAGADGSGGGDGGGGGGD